MGVRADRPGVLLRDYHTVGAGYGITQARGGVKHSASTGQPETFLTERFYLCDASFLVALSGPTDVLDGIETHLKAPVWPPFLGRKSCPPASDIFERRGQASDLLDAFRSAPWRPRVKGVDEPPDRLRCIVECEPTDPGARIQFDCPMSFAEPRPGEGRYVRDVYIDLPHVGEPTQAPYHPTRPERMNYRRRAWAERRAQRGQVDRFLCVFCGVPSAITHHITYRHANDEPLEELRSVCRRCHDAITMLETERGMALDRIDPMDAQWRELILARRAAIDEQRKRRRDPERR
jgi:CRISPR system Cascade subunit CasD